MRTQRLEPTLWRTCRVLANRKRLQLLSFLLDQPDQTVSAVAARLKLPLPVASQYLRALNARGFLKPRRVGGRVHYRVATEDAVEPARTLGQALRLAFEQDPRAAEKVFRFATAFTHPRRMELFRALRKNPGTAGQLMASTGFSFRAVSRQLAKLEARGFVVRQSRTYAAAEPRDGFGRALAWLAGAE